MGNKMTAGRIEGDHTGWALMPFVGETAHHWQEWPLDDQLRADGLPDISEGGRRRYWKSLCGHTAATNDRFTPLHPGSWPLCKRCQRSLDKGAQEAVK